MGHVLGCVLLAYCKGKEEEGKARNHDTREMLRWEMEQRKKHGWDRSNWDPIPTEEGRKHGWHQDAQAAAVAAVAAQRMAGDVARLKEQQPVRTFL